MGRGGVGVVGGGGGDCSQNQGHMLKLAAMPANAQNLLQNTSWMAKLSHILNKATMLTNAQKSSSELVDQFS